MSLPLHPGTRAAWLIVIGLLLLSAIAAHTLTRVAVRAPDTADVTLDLPAAAGEWTGEDVLYCQNERCLKSFRPHELRDEETCPACGGALDKTTLGERNILPPDTRIARKLYTNPRGEQVHATVVLSGKEQKSIHRPQQCLPAQGFVIVSTRVVQVPLDGRDPLDVSLIRSHRPAARPSGGGPRIVFAYWFTGGGRETASHYRRLAWLAWDNLVHGYRTRWAYVSIQTDDTAAPRAADARVTAFIRDFYPLIRRR